jgi:hypothetical protein
MKIDDLSRELRAAGIRGRLHARIVAEFSDHLQENPAANLGEPRQLARQFADELGTVQARRAGAGAFAALAVAGALLFALFLVVGGMGGFLRGNISGEESIGLVLATLGGQVALAAGTLAGLRAWRLRGRATMPAAQARVIRRRALVGLGSGAVTVISFSLVATQRSSSAWVLGPLALVALAAAVPVLLAATRVAPASAGEAGDLREDIGPWLAPTQLAWLLAALITVGLTLAGVVADDGYDGALRGVLDGGACLLGYAALGPYLGLRRTA